MKYHIHPYLLSLLLTLRLIWIDLDYPQLRDRRAEFIQLIKTKNGENDGKQT